MSDSGMKYENVKKLIDKNMTDKLSEVSILDLIDDLKRRVEKFKFIIKRDYDIDFESTIGINIDDYEVSRLRYNLYYIKHCTKRIEDFNWLIRNRLKFSKLKNLQIFKLILLKEKLMITKPSSNEIANDRSIFKYDIGDELKSHSGEWLEIVAYGIINDEPRYIVVSENGWKSLDECRLANPKVIKGSLPTDKEFSFRLTQTEGRTKIEKTIQDKERLQVLLSNIRLST